MVYKTPTSFYIHYEVGVHTNFDTFYFAYKTYLFIYKVFDLKWQVPFSLFNIFFFRVASSEKVDKENRYSDFCLLSLPYPGKWNIISITSVLTKQYQLFVGL